jgi:lantibiotic modifying enzyme
VYTAFLLELTTPSILGRRQRVGRTAIRLSGLPAVGSHRRVVASELLDLWRGDIPWFTTSPQSPRVRHHGGRVVANTSRTGLEALSLRLSLLRDAEFRQRLAGQLDSLSG